MQHVTSISENTASVEDLQSVIWLTNKILLQLLIEYI